MHGLKIYILYCNCFCLSNISFHKTPVVLKFLIKRQLLSRPNQDILKLFKLLYTEIQITRIFNQYFMLVYKIFRKKLICLSNKDIS